MRECKQTNSEKKNENLFYKWYGACAYANV